MHRPRHLGALLALVCGSPALAGVEYVVPDQVPFLSVAIANAQDGDIITLMPSGSPYAQFPGFAFSNKALTIRGSTGDPADVVLDGVDLDIVLTVGPNASGTVIQDLTIRGGYNDIVGPDSAVNGAGLALIDAGQLVTVENCIFEDNFATHPVSDARAAAIFAKGTNVVVRDCHFQNNAVQSPGADGGAIWFWTGTHLIDNCTFDSNTAVNTGGAVRLDTTVTQITGCTFTGNVCTENGGALWTRSSDNCTIDSCIFTSNTSDEGGAIESNSDASSLVVRNTLFQGNHALVKGGAISSGASLVVHNSTFEGNTTDSVHAAIAADTAEIANADIYNSIFWGNLPATGQIITNGATTPVVRNAIIEGGLSGANVSDVLDLDPLFVDAPGGDLALTASSPAIDAGDTTHYQGPLVDLAGAVRGVDDPDTVDSGFSVIGPVIDLGAYELQVDDTPAPTCDGDVNGDGMVNTVDLLALLAAWGTCP